MERLAEQIVDWHNRHPLARRITVGDIHTIGVVALPFVRASAQAGGLVEPVLTDAVTFDELHGAPPMSRGAVWLQKLRGLAARLRGQGPRTQWRAFNEKFLPGLSPAQVERFALAYGFAEPPASPESRPWRVVVIDEALAGAHGGWPFELYLMSAGVDAGSGRTRVLAGRGIPSEIAGRRLWDPLRLGIAAGLLVLLAGAAGYALWPRHAPQAAAPAEAASAPAAEAASVPASATPAEAEPASTPASQHEAASVPAAEGSAPEAAASGPADAPAQPDIRPRLVERADGSTRPPLRSSGKPAEKPEEKPAEKGAEKPADPAPEKAPEKPAEAKKPDPADPRLARMAEAPGNAVVALVGPPGTKAEAEALLKRMQEGLKGVHNNPEALQGEVIQTPAGWRATVWPFPSREQAQLINATLVARGMKTKAVNF